MTIAPSSTSQTPASVKRRSSVAARRDGWRSRRVRGWGAHERGCRPRGAPVRGGALRRVVAHRRAGLAPPRPSGEPVAARPGARPQRRADLLRRRRRVARALGHEGRASRRRRGRGAPASRCRSAKRTRPAFADASGPRPRPPGAGAGCRDACPASYAPEAIAATGEAIAARLRGTCAPIAALPQDHPAGASAPPTATCGELRGLEFQQDAFRRRCVPREARR